MARNTTESGKPPQESGQSPRRRCHGDPAREIHSKPTNRELTGKQEQEKRDAPKSSQTRNEKTASRACVHYL
jgi:hypothetical protein